MCKLAGFGIRCILAKTNVEIETLTEMHVFILFFLGGGGKFGMRHLPHLPIICSYDTIEWLWPSNHLDWYFIIKKKTQKING